jgi:thymidylate synthase (FAD)
MDGILPVMSAGPRAAVPVSVRDVSEHPSITVRSDMTVELVRSSASDADVVFAARVSTAGEQSLEDLDADPASAKGLISYLMRERHGSPFEHNSMTFFVQAPIFVWREHMRHRIASYNEESGRYRELKPVFYVPSRERNIVQVGKTGAYEFLPGSDAQYDLIESSMIESCVRSYEAYQGMLQAGVAREVARMVLPVSIYSSAYVTMNARAMMNFLSLRRKAEGSQYPSYPQREIEMVAEAYEAEWARLMPITQAAFVAGGRVAP